MKAVIDDVLLVSGLALVTFGVWQMHQPSAFIVGGLSVCGLAFALSRGRRPARSRKH